MTHPRWSVLVAYGLFMLIGLSSGVNGVLLVEQLADYDVPRAVLGLTFLTGSAGFFVASTIAGPLVHRWGGRLTLVLGGVLFVLAGLYAATRPPFEAFVLVQVAIGFATGFLESVLNAHLAALPNATTLLNRLHAFFGAGALAGPPLAAWLVGFTSWPVVLLVVALVAAPLTAAAAAAFPRRDADPLLASDDVPDPSVADAAPGTGAAPASVPAGGRGLLPQTLRTPAVLLGATLLAAYVGLELGVGNWAFDFLTGDRDVARTLAGYTVSAYWLGLTLGRFVLSPLVTRLGLGPVGLMYVCLGGVVGSTAIAWLAPWTPVLVAGFALLGFFLGPVFPTAMAVVPRLVPARLAPTAIGVMNAGSSVGGALVPWLAGVLAGIDIGMLLPFALGLGLLQVAVWWATARHLARTG